MSTRWWLISLLAWVGCGPEAAPADRIQLLISYPAPTELDPDVLQQHAGCVSIVRPTHFHGDWDRLRRRLMTAAGPSLWRATSSVPGPGRYRMRVEDPNTCGQGGGEGVDGSVFRNAIQVNGTILTVPTLTPSAEGPRSSFEFDVLEDGTVLNPE